MAPIYLEFIFHTERQGCFPSSFGAIKSLHRGLFFFRFFFCLSATETDFSHDELPSPRACSDYNRRPTTFEL